MNGLKLNELYVVFSLIECSFDEVFVNIIDAKTKRDVLLKERYDAYKIYYKDMPSHEFEIIFDSCFNNVFSVLTLEDALNQIRIYESECPNCQDESC